MTSLDLRRKNAPPPPAPATVDNPVAIAQQGLPLPAGSAIAVSRLTPAEREGLQKLGLPLDGETLPGNLAEIIRTVKAEAQDPTLLPVSPDAAPVKPTKEVDISELPPAKQQELREAVRLATLQSQAIAEAQSLNVPLNIQEAIVAAQGPSTITLDMTRPKKQEANPVPPSASTAPQQEPPPSPAPDGGTGLKTERCPHCQWKLETPDPTVPDITDKREFLQCVLGNGRFHKTYSLMGGMIRITFRTLTSSESAKALQQINFDTRDNKLTSATEWFDKLIEYRLCMALVSLHLEGYPPRVLPELDKIQFDGLDPLKTTELPQLLDYVFREFLPQESIKRSVGLQFVTFQRLVEKLEATMDDADFWTGIGQPR